MAPHADMGTIELKIIISSTGIRGEIEDTGILACSDAQVTAMNCKRTQQANTISISNVKWQVPTLPCSRAIQPMSTAGVERDGQFIEALMWESQSS